MTKKHGRSGKQNSRSAVRREIQRTEDIKALLIDLNDQRRKIRWIAWSLGNEEAYAAAEKQEKALIKLNEIFGRYYQDLNVQLNEEE